MHFEPEPLCSAWDCPVQACSATLAPTPNRLIAVPVDDLALPNRVGDLGSGQPL